MGGGGEGGEEAWGGVWEEQSHFENFTFFTFTVFSPQLGITTNVGNIRM